MEDLIKDIISCAKEFDVGTIWLFGSVLEKESKAQDIDIAVEGIAPENFFKFYFHLILTLPKPVDLIDLSLDPPIAPIIKERGILIYER